MADTQNIDKIVALAQLLDAAQQSALLQYAEFLVQKNPDPIRAEKNGTSTPQSEIVPIPRPEDETVVQAIRRLTRTYPNLNKARVLHATSNLMTQHVMQGRPANEVIDELELMFVKHLDSQTPMSDQQ